MRLDVLVLSLVLVFEWADAQDKVKLADVKTLTLRKGAMTTGKRSSPVPQTQCLNSATVQCDSFDQPSVIQCTNTGSDGLRINWECKADLPINIRLYEVKVDCEGYDNSTDPYILYGSCRVNYSLEKYQSVIQPKPAKPAKSTKPPRVGNDDYNNKYNGYTTKKSKGILGGIISGSVIGGLIVLCLCALGVFCICKICCGKCGDGGCGGGHYTPAPTIPMEPTLYYPPAPTIPMGPTLYYPPAPSPYSPSAPAYYPSRYSRGSIGSSSSSSSGDSSGGNTGGGKHESVGFAVTENR